MALWRLASHESIVRSSRETPLNAHNLSFFTLSHTQPLHYSHLNTGFLHAKLQANLARNKVDAWLIKFNLTIRLGPLSTPNIRQNPRSHLLEIRVACSIESHLVRRNGERKIYLGPCAKCARVWLLLFVIYLGLLKVSGGTSLNLMDLLIICVLVASVYMPLILTFKALLKILNLIMHSRNFAHNINCISNDIFLMRKITRIL